MSQAERACEPLWLVRSPNVEKAALVWKPFRPPSSPPPPASPRHIHCGSPLDGVPLAGCLGDQQAAMLGQRCLAAEAKCTYGTGCFMLLHTGPAPVQSQHGLLTTVVYQLGPGAEVQYALEGAVAIAGQGVSWLRDRMGFVASPAEAEELAATVEDTGGVYFVPAFSGLLAPWWREDARGAILGLTQYTTKVGARGWLAAWGPGVCCGSSGVAVAAVRGFHCCTPTRGRPCMNALLISPLRPCLCDVSDCPLPSAPPVSLK